MRKLLAFIICGLIALLAGYTLLPQGFNALVDWLGPVFGLPLVFVFSSLFILLADPFKFISVAILWVVIGLVGGLIIRKRIGSVSTMLSVYSIQFTVLSLSAYALFGTIMGSGIFSNPANILNLLPPVPQGASLATIMSAPIIGDIVAQLQSISLTSFDQGMIINLLMNTVVLNIVKNLVIVSVAALAGCEIGKFAFRPIVPRFEAFRERHMIVPKVQYRSFLLVTFSLIILLSSFRVATPVNATGGLYSENILATVTPQGTAVATAVFVDTSELLRGIDLSNSAFAGSVGAVLVTQKLELSSLASEMNYLMGQIKISGINLDEVLRFYQIVPSTMLIIVYKADKLSQDAAQSQANVAADLFGRKFGTTFTSFIPTGSLPLDNAPVRVFIYQSTLIFSTAADALVGDLPETSRGGLARYIGRVYRSGVVSPGKTPFSANGSVLVTGFLNTETVVGQSKDFGLELPSFLAPFKGKIPFWALGCYFASRFHSSPIILHELNIVIFLPNS